MAATSKEDFLRQHRVYNADFRRVVDPLFHDSDFFDSRDRVRVKYELLRRVRVEGYSVVEAARLFGFSRTSYYDTLRQWQAQGFLGLLPEIPGPRGPHKLTAEIVAFLEALQAQEGPLAAVELVQRLRQERGVEVV